MSDIATATTAANKMSKFHLGCGSLIAEGFVNVDERFGEISSELKAGAFYALQEKPNTFVLKHDLREGIPALPGSLDVIYHSHFLEHLSREDGNGFLEQCHRCLKPGGLMRIVVPDFELWCKNYVNGDDQFFDWYKTTYLGRENPAYRTNAQIFTGMIYNHGHQMAYDYKTLVHLLGSAGFVNIKRCHWGSSEHLFGIEKIEDSQPGFNSQRRHESLLIECEKGMTQAA